MTDKQLLDISWSTIIKISFAFLCLYTFYLVRDIFLWCIFALIISVLFNPAITFLQKFRLPRVLATILVYFTVLGILIFMIHSMVPLFVNEFSHFSQALPQYFEKVSPSLERMGFKVFTDVETFVSSLSGYFEKMALNVFSVLLSFFGGVFSTIFIISVAIFLSLEEKSIEKNLALLFPQKERDNFLSFWERCQSKVSGWFATRVIASIFVGLACCIVFLLFDVKYPFSLGLLAGVFNFIPVIGPIIMATFIFVIVFLDSALRAFFILIAFVLIQQIENTILTPILSKKFVGMSPAMVLVALALGGQLWGVMGAILAVPMFGILFEVLKEYLRRREEETETKIETDIP